MGLPPNLGSLCFFLYNLKSTQVWALVLESKWGFHLISFLPPEMILDKAKHWSICHLDLSSLFPLDRPSIIPLPEGHFADGGEIIGM
jgi:hypothetical protein